jgi:acyl-CoA thioesterase-1
LLTSIAAPLAARAQGAPRVLMLGDSLTAGYGLQPDQALPVRLEAWLKQQGRAVTMLNAGVSGDTSAGGRARLGWAMADRPTHAIVALGANDALRGLDPRDTEANLDAVLAELKAKKVPVLLLGMVAPPNLGSAYADQFNPLYARLAARHGALLYPFILDGVAMDRSLNQGDGIHPNPKGVDVLAARIGPWVEKLVALPGA